jgi:hypothetical protein
MSLNHSPKGQGHITVFSEDFFHSTIICDPNTLSTSLLLCHDCMAAIYHIIPETNLSAICLYRWEEGKCRTSIKILEISSSQCCITVQLLELFATSLLFQKNNCYGGTERMY